MKQLLKRWTAGLLVILTIFTTTFTNGSIVFAARSIDNLSVWYASVKDSGVVSELKAGYDHGKVLYAMIDGHSAYCMNYGLSASGGQQMSSHSNSRTSMTAKQESQLLYCLHFGFSSTTGTAPSDNQSNKYIATQAMVWIIEGNIFGTSAADSAAKKLCNTAPDADASYSYYTTLKKNISDSLNAEIPSFSKYAKSDATTYELKWSESNQRFETTLTDTNGSLADFDVSISGYKTSRSGNKLTIYSSQVDTSTTTGTLQSNSGCVTITGSCVYWLTGSSSDQEFVSEVPAADPLTAYIKVKTENIGYGELYKKDEASGVSLKGAVYGIYSNSSCTQLVEKLTTDANGHAKSGALTAGTYYVKEITAPNKYVISSKVHTLQVNAGKTTTINATDKEQKGAITIYKEGEVLTGWNGSNFTYEKRKLPGATFKVTAGADIYRADGTKAYNAGDLIAQNLKTGSDGKVLLSDLHLGTYVVTETASINGYTINTTPQTVNIAYKDQTVEVQYESTTVLNTRQTAEVSVVKRDSDTNNPLVGGKYSIYAGGDIKNYDGAVIATKGTLLQTITTGSDGSAKFTVDLPIANGYYISETQAPYGYVRNQSDVYSFSFNYLSETTAKATFSHTFINDRTTAKIHLFKVDKETGLPVPQGDASLTGAVYGLYARENIIHPDGATGVLFKAGDLVKTMTTNDKAESEVKNLYLGKYYVKEITPPEGYLLDEEEHDVLCDYEGDLVVEVSRSTKSREQVYKQPFQLIKVSDNGDDTEAPLLSGAGFTAYLKSSLSVKKDGSYDFDNAKPVILGKNGETTIYTDDKGYLVSIPIPYGTYVVIESVTPHNMQTIKPFEVKITKHKPTEPQTWRVFLDREFTAKLRIVKKDFKTGQTVLVPNAEFKIYNMDTKEYVVQYTTYPSKVKHTSFFTDADGDLVLPETLKLGNYRIEEVAAPDGYIVNNNYVLFAVDTNTAYETDSDTYEAIITMDYVDNPAVGELTVEKKGEVLKDHKGGLFAGSEEKDFVYQEGSLAGAEFEVYAAEDIYTNDYQLDKSSVRTKYYSKGDLVATLVTGEDDGTATLSDIPLGTYRVVETKAPFGYVLNKEEQKVTFTYVDDKTPVIQESLTFANERQKVSLSVKKLDEETELPITGAEFGLYAAEGIKNVDGKVIVQADTLLETAVSGTDGVVHFKKDLPLGSYYAKETKAPLGYVSSEETVEYDAAYQGQAVDTVKLQSEFMNVPTTVEITKTDITSGEELSGATLSVIDKDGVVVDTWTSVADEPHIIERLHVGKNYTLREEFAPYGYLQAEEVQFTISDTEELQKVEMKDEVPTGTIIINKDGEFVTDINLVKGKWYDFIFDYFRKSLAGVEFEVYAAEDIVSPDGLDTLYYEEDELVATIVTNEKGIASIGELPLGKYYLIETKTLGGFVLDSSPIEADLSYVDQYTKIVYAGMDVNNVRQKVKVTVMKTDAETGEELEGAVFGLFTAEDIVNTDGKLIVSNNTLVEKAVTGKDGTCVFTSDLPLGQYYVKEITAPKGYVTNDEIYEIDASYQDEDISVIEFEAEFENYPTKVQISKTDITGEHELEGAELSIISKDGEVIESWVSDRKIHLIEKIPVGTYILREETAPYGYKIANDVEFTVEDTEDIQRVVMKDELVKGKIIIEKKDSVTGKGIKGVTFEIRDKKGKVIESLITDKNGHAESKTELDIAVFKGGKFVKDKKYCVVEIKAAEGYILDSTPHEVVLQYDDHAPDVVIYTLELTNKPTETKLPQTGDNANPWIYIGLGLFGIVMGFLVLRKKKDIKNI